MPANLTPQYQKAEEEYRQADSAAERLDCLQRMLQLIPKHKGTDKLQAQLKSRIKEAKGEVEHEKKGGKKGPSFRFPRQGAGQVVLLGGPSSGKSRIVAELTKAEPLVADYPFSTHEPAPAMMPWEDTTVQLIDTPPITDSHCEPYMINLTRAADAIALCFNGASDDAPEDTLHVIEQLAQRKTQLGNATEFDDEDFSIQRLKTLLVVTHAGDPDCETRLDLLREMIEITFPVVTVELDDAESTEALRTALYRLLNVIRVYTKKPGSSAEYEDPFTIPAEGTVEELAYRVHRDQAEKLKYARLWGDSAHDGQTVGKDHVLADRDLIELHW